MNSSLAPTVCFPFVEALHWNGSARTGGCGVFRHLPGGVQQKPVTSRGGSVRRLMNNYITSFFTWPMAKLCYFFLGLHIFSRENKPFNVFLFQGPGRLSESFLPI